MLLLSAISSLLFTIAVYIIARLFHYRFPSPFTLPLLTSTAFIVSVLLLIGIPYETYHLGGQWLEKLLGPTVVALAYPLYRQVSMLRANLIPIVVSVAIGAVTGVVSGYLLAKVLGVETELIHSLIPKSVTTPIAMEVSDTLGGIPALAAILVTVAGVSGSIVAPYVFRWFNIKSDFGRGIGVGSAAHAIGTAKSFENSELEGVISSVAMTLSAIFVTVIVSVLVLFF